MISSTVLDPITLTDIPFPGIHTFAHMLPGLRSESQIYRGSFGIDCFTVVLYILHPVPTFLFSLRELIKGVKQIVASDQAHILYPLDKSIRHTRSQYRSTPVNRCIREQVYLYKHRVKRINTELRTLVLSQNRVVKGQKKKITYFPCQLQLYLSTVLV